MTTAIHDELSAEVSAIYGDSLRSLRALKRWSDAPDQAGVSVRGARFAQADVRHFTKLIEGYRRSLMRVARAAAGPDRKQTAVARALILHSFAAHICGLLRAFVRCRHYASPQKIIAMATAGKRCPVLREKVHSKWVEKSSGGHRLVTRDGPARTAQRLVYRDMLAILGIDSEFDYSRQRKGEKALLTEVSTAIEGGYQYWWTPDVQNCFASLKPSHFRWLPLTRHEIRNILFTPECARVAVFMPRKGDKLYPWIAQNYPDYSNGPIGQVLLTMRLTRQGVLQQGAVHAPLLARGFLGRELRTMFGGDEGIVSLSFADDLAIGARLKKDAQAAKTALSERLNSHPAGPVHLHEKPVQHAEMDEVEVLGYFLEPGNGYGGGTHVKPGPTRCDRFRRRLAERLAAADPAENEYVVGEAYWKQWYASQHAWTKVPFCTADASLTITYGYVTSFIKGHPMKGNAPIYDKLIAKA